MVFFQSSNNRGNGKRGDEAALMASSDACLDDPTASIQSKITVANEGDEVESSIVAGTETETKMGALTESEAGAAATTTTTLTTTPQDTLLTFQEAAHCPTVYNNTNHSIVVVLERGIFYRPQVLQPGEAASWTRRQTGGIVLSPYHVHVMVGDERSIPTAADSNRHLLQTAAIPAAFCMGCMLTAASAGVLAGPSAALAPLVSGMVINGIVVDAAAIAAGGIAANRAQAIADFVIAKHPDKVMLKSPRYLPGKRFLMACGGLADGSLSVHQLSEGKFRKDVVEARTRQLQEQRSRGVSISTQFVIKAPRATLSQSQSQSLSSSPKACQLEDKETLISKTIGVLLRKKLDSPTNGGKELVATKQ